MTRFDNALEYYRKWTKDLFVVGIVMGLFIGAITFVNGGFHPMEWSIEGRVIFVVISGAMSFCTIGVRRNWFA